MKVSWMFSGRGSLSFNGGSFTFFPARSNVDNGGYYFWHIKSGTIQREMPLWPKELKTPLMPPTRFELFRTARENHIKSRSLSNSPIPGGDGTNSLFSVAFNSLYNYNAESNGSVLNGSCNTINGNSQSAVARSTSSHALDLDQENKKRKDLEYKYVCSFVWIMRILAGFS